MKRTAHPSLSPVGQEAVASYERWLRERENLAAASIRNYLSRGSPYFSTLLRVSFATLSFYQTGIPISGIWQR